MHLYGPLLVLLTAGRSLAAPHPDWQVGTIAGDVPLSVYHSLAVAPTGEPAACFVDESARKLILARLQGTAWNREVIDPGDGINAIGSYNSLAFGPDGHPAVAYRRRNTVDPLHYALFNGTSWSLTPIPGAGAVPRWCSLRFSPAGLPAIAYRHSSLTLAFASFDGSNWAVENSVDPSILADQNSSLAFAPATGRPAIAYWYATDKQIRFIEKGTTTWNSPTNVATLGAVTNPDPSLAWSPAGNPAIAFRDIAAGQLRFAERIGGSWVIENVAPMTTVGLIEALELRFHPVTGEPAIAYTQPSSLDLCYATRGSGGWTTITVDPDGDTGRHPKLAFNPDGQPHITYLLNDGGTHRLRHATIPRQSGFASFGTAAKSAWMPNAGWIHFRHDTPLPPDGVVIGDRFLSGKAWAPNFGWIHFGDGSPENGIYYGNDSATDFGVNRSPAGTLEGRAWAPNIGWIHFGPDKGFAAVNLATGTLSGHAWAPNIGWIQLARAMATTLDSRDSDGDGIADDLERNAFGSLTTANASTDSDGDGASDADELTAGSDPNDSTSWFRIVSQETAAGRTSTTLEFTSTPARFYQILTSENLASWTPDTIQHGVFQGEQGTTRRTLLHDPGTRLFFAVSAHLPLNP